jgi:hypothetical protein
MGNYVGEGSPYVKPVERFTPARKAETGELSAWPRRAYKDA